RWNFCDTRRRDCPSDQVSPIHAVVRRSAEVHRSDRRDAAFAEVRIRRRHQRPSGQVGEVPVYQFNQVGDRREELMMTMVLLAVAVFAANQGSAIQLTFANEPGVKNVEVVWESKHIPAFLIQDKWTTIVGVDLDAKPGEHKADVLFTMEDG